MAVSVIVVVAFLGGVTYGLFRLLRPDTPIFLPPPRCGALIGTDDATIDIEQSENASLIAGVAAERGLVPRAVSIALATAFQESKIRNLDYGDRDSLGLFQQRPSAGWGTPEEIMDPHYATNKFFDALERVPDWPNWDIGDVAQEVQRSAFPDAYDQHVAKSRLLASALSGETPGAWSCVVRDPGPPDPDGLIAGLTPTYQATIRIVESIPADPDNPVTSPARLAIEASTPEVAWSAGAFAQSWATATGVHSVQVGNQLWTADPENLTSWVAMTESVAPTRVVVTFDAIAV
jgi:hypothetical protein